MTADTISEAASEKPPRGRPRLMRGEYLQTSRAMWPELGTERALQDRHFALGAINALGGVVDERLTRWPYFFPGRERFRWSLLAELGRLLDSETIIEAATVLNAERPNVKDAVRRLRAFRTGRKPTGDAKALQKILTSAIATYLDATSCGWETALEALDRATRVCEAASRIQEGDE